MASGFGTRFGYRYGSDTQEAVAPVVPGDISAQLSSEASVLASLTGTFPLQSALEASGSLSGVLGITYPLLASLTAQGALQAVTQLYDIATNLTTYSQIQASPSIVWYVATNLSSGGSLSGVLVELEYALIARVAIINTNEITVSYS